MRIRPAFPLLLRMAVVLCCCCVFAGSAFGANTAVIWVFSPDGELLPDATVQYEDANGHYVSVSVLPDGTRVINPAPKLLDLKVTDIVHGNTQVVVELPAPMATVNVHMGGQATVFEGRITVPQSSMTSAGASQAVSAREQVGGIPAQLSASTDVPVGGNPACPGDGNCCTPGGNGTPGCDDESCCNTVCAIDPFCCDTSWDGICADEALDLCPVCMPECGDGVCEGTESCANCPADCGDCPDCPIGDLEEPEACGDDTNGGCNSTPPAFTNADCGSTWSGSSWATGGMRDTDWYLIAHGGGLVTGSLCSQFPGVSFVVDGIGACAPAVVGDIGCSDGNVPIADASADLPSGNYVVFVAPGDCAGGGVFEGFPCGSGANEYVIAIGCTEVSADCGNGVCELGENNDNCPEDCFCGNGSVDPGEQCDDGNNDDGDGCAADCTLELCPGEGGSCCTPGGNGTPGCDDVDCCELICAQDPFCCDVSWDGLCADAAILQCAVCQEPGACCFTDGSCQEISPADCIAMGGEPVGGGCDGAGCVATCGEGAGDCCVEGGNGTPGCDDPDCCNLVCSIDPFCCDTSWDGICASEALDLCEICMPECGDGVCDEPLETCASCPADCGACPECECPEGATIEDEACGDDTNGGCNSTPVAFAEANCGDTICGTGWADGGMRDTDWYLVGISDGTISATLQSQFPGVSFIVDGIAACAPAVVGDIGCSENCIEIADASADLPAGEYVVFVAAGTCAGGGIFEGFPCGSGANDYTVSISCEGIGPPTGACCLPDGTCVNDLTEEDCVGQGGTYQGDDSACEGEPAGYAVEDCENPFNDISGSGTLAPIASSTDDGGDIVGISFNFNFYGDDHNTVGIASNGYLTFGADLGDFTNDPIPTAEDPNDYIGPLWDDWSPNQAGDVYYEDDGSCLTVQWDGVPHFNSGGSATFQAVICDDNSIEYRYGAINFDSPTVGVENQSGTDGDPGGFGPAVGEGDCVRLTPDAGDPIECPVAATQQTLIIKQGACPAPVNLGSNGVVPMVLVGTDEFDVSQVAIDSLSLSLCGGDDGIAPIDGPPGPMIQILDLNHAEEPVVTCDGEGCACNENQSSDGIDDLEMKFSTDELAALLGEVSGVIKLELSGSLNNGDLFTAVDCIAVVPAGQGAVNASVDTNTPDAFIDFQPFDLNWDTGGFGNFSRTFVSATSVTITADMMSPDGRKFFRWIIDGVPQPVGLNSMTVNLADNMSLRAIYGRHKNLGEQAPDVPF